LLYRIRMRDNPYSFHITQTDTAEPFYEQNLLFDKQRNVKGISVDMRGRRPWGWFGISQVNLLR